MVKIFASSIDEIKTGFLGDADSFTIVTNKLSPSNVLESIKLSVLLYDYTIIAAAYFWQSSSMQIITSALWPFVEIGLLLPSVRSPQQTRDVLEYAERRMVDTFSLSNEFIYNFPALASEIATPECLKVAKNIDSRGSILYRDQGSVEAIYRDLWQKDIVNDADPRSVYNIVMGSVSEDYMNEINLILRSILNQPFFSRSEIARVIFFLPWRRSLQSALVHRASFLYLKSNALVTNSELVTNASYTSSWQSFGPLEYSNLNVFKKALQILGISAKEIANLSAKDILTLKSAAEFRAFRKVYSQLALKASGDVKLVQKKVARKLSGERFRSKATVILKYIEEVANHIFTEALMENLKGPIVYNPQLLVTSGSASVISRILRGLDAFNKTPLMNFEAFWRCKFASLRDEISV